MMVGRTRSMRATPERTCGGDPVRVEIGEGLTTRDIVRVAQERAEVALSPYARGGEMRSRAGVGRRLREGRVTDGLTTGGREFARVHIALAGAH
jgi:histidine ammonia-lyase